MANLPYPKDEKRPHPVLFKPGERFGMHTPKGTVYGTSSHADGGGWIYPEWEDTLGQSLPGWIRCTQLFKAPKEVK